MYPAPQYSGSAEVVPEGKKTYYIREGTYGAFYPGRCCDIIVVDGDKEIVRMNRGNEL